MFALTRRLGPRGRWRLVGVAAVALAAGYLYVQGPRKQYLAFTSSATGTSQYVYVGMFVGLVRPHLPKLAFVNEAVSGTTESLDLMRRGEATLAIGSPER